MLIMQQNRQKQFIINMDQTPYDLHDSPRKRYTKGDPEQLFLRRLCKMLVGWVTICLAVWADGYKPTPNGC